MQRRATWTGLGLDRIGLDRPSRGNKKPSQLGRIGSNRSSGLLVNQLCGQFRDFDFKIVNQLPTNVDSGRAGWTICFVMVVAVVSTPGYVEDKEVVV